MIGAGDYIGGAIAKKFAAEGFTVFAGRRQGDKLAPLVAEVEANGGRIYARSLDARKEDDLTAFLQDADKQAPLEVCSSISVPTSIFHCSRRLTACSASSRRWPATPGSWQAGKRPA